MIPTGRRYVFREHWVLGHRPAAVHEVLNDLGRYPVWWPQVRAVARLGPDDAWVLCRSVLPYTLNLVLHVEQRDREVLATSVTGDLDGWVRWRLHEDGGRTVVDFEQEVVVARPVLAAASAVGEPMLRWNHHRMMAGCRRGLERWLAHRDNLR